MSVYSCGKKQKVVCTIEYSCPDVFLSFSAESKDLKIKHISLDNKILNSKDNKSQASFQVYHFIGEHELKITFENDSSIQTKFNFNLLQTLEPIPGKEFTIKIPNRNRQELFTYKVVDTTNQKVINSETKKLVDDKLIVIIPPDTKLPYSILISNSLNHNDKNIDILIRQHFIPITVTSYN